MGATALTLPPRYTPEQYLELEERSEVRSEYLDGYIYAMSGAALPHVQIQVNLIHLLVRDLRSAGVCRAMSSEMKIWLSRQNAFVYPDASVYCGSPRFYRNRTDVIENPSVVFEILSDSTEKYDRGHKFHAYQTLPELKQYVLISQHTAMVEVFTKDVDRWIFRTFDGLESVAELDAIGVRIQLSELYEYVEFPPAALPTAPDHTPTTE